MGVPFEKANSSAASILSEAEYILGVVEAEPQDLFPEARAALIQAMLVIAEVLAKGA
jgi:hypothetical protein